MNVTMKGQEVNLIGTQPIVGEKAPDFTLKNLEDVSVSLAALRGMPILISVVPDIDTRVCSLQTKRFNQEAAKLSNVKFLTISNNTKEEQKNWCAAEGVDMEMLHDTDNTFGEAYGLLIKETKRLARSIIVIDETGSVSYVEVVPEISQEPNYDEALANLG